MSSILIPVAAILGWLAGIIVNALADDLPCRRNPGTPTYPDGTPRPISAWSGILAFVLNQRAPAQPEPDDERKHLYREGPRLSWRYPLTEVTTIALMMLSVSVALENAAHISSLQLLFWLFYIPIIVLIIVIDIEYKLILFIVTIPSILLAFVDAAIAPPVGPVQYGAANFQDALLGGLAGFVPFFILYQGGFLFTYIMGKIRGEEINTVAFGYGDVMLMTLTGVMLGLGYTVLAMFIAVFLGALGAFLYIITRAVIGRRYSMFTALPYGPYIAVANLALLLYGPQIRLSMMGY